MPRVGEVFAYLDALSPLSLQESWDDSGLLVGDLDAEVAQIIVALEASHEVIDSTPPHSLLIVHHPLIFKSLKSLLWDEYPANLLRLLIQKDIHLMAWHTPFDKTHLGRYVASEILGFDAVEMDGYVAYFPLEMEREALAAHLKNRLNLSYLPCVGEGGFFSRGALITGSGASMLASVRADCLLTGDIKYHDAMIAKSLGMTLFDIGHYESERHFVDVLASCLKKQGYEAIITDSKSPFHFS